MAGHPGERRQVYLKPEHLFYQEFCFLFELGAKSRPGKGHLQPRGVTGPALPDRYFDRHFVKRQYSTISRAVPEIYCVLAAAPESPRGQIQPKRRNRDDRKRESVHKIILLSSALSCVSHQSYTGSATSRSILGGHLKTGQLGSPQKRPVRRPSSRTRISFTLPVAVLASLAL